MIENITSYFSTMPTLHRTSLLIGGLAFFFILENTFPLFKKKYNKWQHTGVNLFFTLTTVLVNFLLAFLLIASCSWVTENEFGMINWLSLGIVPAILIGIPLMDFVGAYLVHYIEHKIPWMWQFHLIHHTDQNVDTTTGNRHHPGESIFRFGFTVLAIFITGTPIWMIFLYQSLSLVATQFTHTNLNYPAFIDKTIGWIFVTPRMHRVHHHYRMPYSDSNYGNIFSIWDRLLGTYIEVDNSKLIYGVDTHMEHSENKNIWSMLKIPFLPYRGHINYDKSEKL
jgi:sterol desaturase/sphingolipid hydroxylase (fatty acid hydroxylase superfamily)